MISPTGLGIRSDSEGDGNYGASRGSKRHNGQDYECKKGQDIKAPFDLVITRIAYPETDCIMQGIAWKRGKSTGRMFYFKPDMNLVGNPVKQGAIIGKAQSVSEYYKLPKMKDHVHFRVDK